MSKALNLFFLLAFATGSVARAEDGQQAAAVRSLIDAEKSFARTAGEKGTREAFLTFLAENSTVFEPGPVNGRKSWEGRKSDESLLAWNSSFAVVSQAGDLGYTTGPWTWKKNRNDEKSGASGEFFSIWKKQNDGAWKVVLDHGVDTPRPIAPDDSTADTATVETPGKTNADRKVARRSLQRAQREFFEASARDNGAAVARIADPDVRVLRSGVFPAAGKESARVMLSSDHARTTFQRKGGDISSSGDLAYDYGEFATERMDHTERGTFVSVWRTATDGTWKLAVDLRKARPKSEKPPE
ncbi:MAG: nuclear transport factor 2 family protein [Chthoniobacterales bacterium]